MIPLQLILIGLSTLIGLAHAKKTVTLSISKTGAGEVSSTPTGILCGTSCSSEFKKGRRILLTATPDAGATFLRWSGCSARRRFKNQCKVKMNKNKLVKALFSARQFQLSILKKGNGEVSSSPRAIACGDTCTAKFTENTEVVLTATNVEDTTFGGWGGGWCSGTGECTVKVDAAKTVTAKFNHREYPLSISITGAGTVTDSTIDCSSNCSRSYAANTMVKLNALPNAGATFGGWGGGWCSGTGECVVTIDDAKTVTAKFNESAYPLNLSVKGDGTVSSTPAGLNNCAGSCTASFLANTSVVLNATAGAESSFGGWGGGWCSGTGKCTINMDQEKPVTATFNDPTYTLNLSVTGAGTVSSTPAGLNNCAGSCTASFLAGTLVSLQATATAGSSFGNWGGGWCGSREPSCSITVNQTTPVTVKFNSSQYLLNLTIDGMGTVTSEPTGINCNDDCAALFAADTQLTLTATSEEGYGFDGWSKGWCSGTGQCRITMDQEKPLGATFSPR